MKGKLLSPGIHANKMANLQYNIIMWYYLSLSFFTSIHWRTRFHSFGKFYEGFSVNFLFVFWDNRKRILAAFDYCCVCIVNCVAYAKRNIIIIFLAWNFTYSNRFFFFFYFSLHSFSLNCMLWSRESIFILLIYPTRATVIALSSVHALSISLSSLGFPLFFPFEFAWHAACLMKLVNLSKYFLESTRKATHIVLIFIVSSK